MWLHLFPSQRHIPTPQTEISPESGQQNQPLWKGIRGNFFLLLRCHKSLGHKQACVSVVYWSWHLTAAPELCELREEKPIFALDSANTWSIMLLAALSASSIRNLSSGFQIEKLLKNVGLRPRSKIWTSTSTPTSLDFSWIFVQSFDLSTNSTFSTISCWKECKEKTAVLNKQWINLASNCYLSANLQPNTKVHHWRLCSRSQSWQSWQKSQRSHRTTWVTNTEISLLLFWFLMNARHFALILKSSKECSASIESQLCFVQESSSWTKMNFRYTQAWGIALTLAASKPKCPEVQAWLSLLCCVSDENECHWQLAKNFRLESRCLKVLLSTWNYLLQPTISGLTLPPFKATTAPIISMPSLWM